MGWGGGGEGLQVDRKQDILFLGMSQVDQAQDLFFWEGGGQNRSGPKTRLLFVFGYITNGSETRLFFFGGARGRGRKQDFGDNWIAIFCRDMEACALVPTWNCKFNKSSSQLQWREELMDFNALLTRERESKYSLREKYKISFVPKECQSHLMR